MVKAVADYLQKWVNVRREEWLPLLLATAFFFCVLTALMVVRPARDALGMQRGIESVRWLFFGTAFVTLLVNPLFGWLVSRMRRIKFIAATYLFFMASLLVFFALLTMTPDAVGETSGQVFYVWFSVFNLFSTMVFWAVMADCFSLEQSKRLFAFAAVGGTAGAIAGPAMAALLVEPLGTPALLLISVSFLGLALLAAWALTRVAASRLQHEQGDTLTDHDTQIIGGQAWAGLRRVFESRYLLGIATYVMLTTIIFTFIYFTRLQMVAALGDDLDMRTGMFARIELITQSATLLLQLIVAGHLMKRIGVSFTLALLPITVVLGFIGLAIVGTLAALVVFEACYRAVQRGVMRPARETLYTVVSREDKYKSKAFSDTFVYRAGDIVGAQVEGLLVRLGMGLTALASVAIPLAAAWAVLAFWLGRTQQRIERVTSRALDLDTASNAATPSPQQS